MIRKGILFAALMTALSTNGQSMDALLKSVEQNNAQLTAYKKAADATKTANHAEVVLDDLDLGYNRLWGNPSTIGNRHDVSVSQPIDLPTVFGTKSKVAKGKDALVDDEYLVRRQEILLEAQLGYVDAVYYNALINTLQRRCNEASAMSDMQKKQLEAGDINIIDYNNMHLSLSNVTTALTQAKAERDAVLAQLKQLNGGIDVIITDSVYSPVSLPENFDEWFDAVCASAPTVNMTRNAITLGRRQLALAKQGWLPKLSLGYMSEKTLGEQYQGITLGMSVPLWSAGKKVKQAKAEAAAAEAMHTATIEGLKSVLASEYALTKGLIKAAADSKATLQTNDNTTNLQKACKAGEMSTLEYLVSLTSYYEAVDKMLSSEREAQKAYARLTMYLL
ncbi:MAG: TolC family protein [Prevotella sp.]